MGLSDVLEILKSHGAAAGVAATFAASTIALFLQNMKLTGKIEAVHEKRVEEAKQSIETNIHVRAALEANNRILERLMVSLMGPK